MKRKFSKILGVGVTLALLCSLLLTAAPAAAISVPAVTLDTYVISQGAVYTLTFQVTKALGAGDDFTITAGAPNDADTFTMTATTIGTVTVVATTGGVAFAITETGATPTTIVGGVITFGDIGDIVTVTATANGTAGTITPGTGASTDVVGVDTDADAVVTSQVSFSLPDTTGTFTYAVTAGSVSAAITTDADSDATIVGGVITLPDAADVATVIATAIGTTGTLTASGGDNGAAATVAIGHDTDADAAIGGAAPNWTFSLPDMLVGNIIVTFLTGTSLAAITAAADVDVQVGAGPGIGTAGYGLTNATSALDATGLILTITPPADINNAAWVQVVIGTTNNVVNPPTPGSYTLTVATTAEAVVTSAPYVLTVPVIPPVPGVVAGYNIAGIKLVEVTGVGAITNALLMTNVVRVVAGNGTYDEDITVGAGQTLTALNTGFAVIKDVNTILAGVVTVSGVPDGIGGSVSLDGIGATVTGLTVFGSGTTSFAVRLNIAGGATVSNCTIGGLAGEDALVMAAGLTATPAVSSGNTINAVAGQKGITVNSGVVGTSTGDIIVVVATATGISNSGTLTVSSGAITGTAGTGIQSVVAAAVTTITGTSFTTLAPAITVTDGTLTVSNASTISGCGSAVVGSEVPSINVVALTDPDGAGTLPNNTVQISGSTIENSVNDILQVTANSNFVFVNFNTLTGNALSFDNNDVVTANALDATNNWWGTTAGPAVASTGNVLTTPFLTAAVSNQQLAVAVAGGTTTSWQTTAGVDILLSGAVPDSTLAAANYDTNPAGTVAPPGTVTQYFDVYRQGAVLAGADSITIRFYGIQSTGAQVYAWSAAQSTWVLASGQVIDQFRGCVTVTITTLSTPNSANLGGLPFALVAGAGAAPGTPEIATPTSGDDTVSLTPIFAWEAVTGADGYYFQFADNADFVPPLLAKLDGDLGRLVVTAYAYRTELSYSKAYYWRVKAVSGTEAAGDLAESAWTSSVFITIAEPVVEPEPEPEPPVWMCSEGLTFVSRAALEAHLATAAAHQPVEAPDIIVPLPAETPITPGWIYAIIGVGAVLVIGLIVLIVRTRRVA